MKHDEEKLTREREEAWVGDAVLALFVREWILGKDGGLDGDKFIRFTSNDFLRVIGNPTSVEAGIDTNGGATTMSHASETCSVPGRNDSRNSAVAEGPLFIFQFAAMISLRAMIFNFFRDHSTQLPRAAAFLQAAPERLLPRSR